MGVQVQSYKYSVFPGKDGKLIQAGNEVPARSDVASDEDAEGEDGEGVHRALAIAVASACLASVGRAL